MMLAKILSVALACSAVLLAFSAPEDRGQELFARRCSGCHALDANKEGPRLRGVFGRKAGSVPDFPYSEALKKSGLRWDAASLDRWLTNPETVAPDNDMPFRVGDADERKALVEYLKGLTNK